MNALKSLWQKWRRTAARPAAAVPLGVAACLLLPYLYACMCEFVRAGSVYYTRLYIEAHLLQLALGAVVTTLLFAAVMVLTARPWVANLLVGGALCAASWVNLQKLAYRETPLLPRDFVQAGAAADIAGELHLSVPRETWLFLLLLLLTTVLLAPVRLYRRSGKRAWAASLLGGAALLACLPLYMSKVLYNKPWMADHGVLLSAASLADSYYRGSFVTSFCTMTGGLFGVPAPAGYSREAVASAAALEPTADTDGQRHCDVIVVLLESYFDLDNYDTAAFSEPLGENFRHLAAEGISGQMLSEFYGGGTANVEFSVLTGYAYSLLPVGSMPYIEYIHDGFLCYPQYLHQAGYQTLALHPYHRNFYNRDNAYPQMGFAQYTTEETFDDTAIVGNYVGEQATFDKALELYREAAAAGPVFLHIVTMQNHVPNQPGEYPDGYAVQAHIEGESDYYNGCLSSVATSLRDVDRAVGNFVDALRDEPRDIVVLFFGDHQTNINSDTGEDLLSHIASFTALDGREQTLRQHVTPYLMWANFETGLEGADGGLLPADELLPTLLTAYDVVRPAWMDWLAAEDAGMRELHYSLCFDDEEARLAGMSEAQRAAYQARALLQYDLMFGRQYAAETLYQKAAPDA